MSVDHKFRIPLAPTAEPDADTHLDVSIYKNDHGVAVGSIHPARYLPNGVVSFELMSEGSAYFALEPMKRLNRKRLDALLAQAKDDVSSRRGVWWDQVQKCVAQMKGRSLPDPVQIA